MRHAFLIICTILLSLRAKAQSLPELIPFRSGGLWGYADTTGKVVLQPRWNEALFFRNGRAVVRAKGKHGLWYCTIDKKGRYIIPPERGWTGYFTNSQISLNCINEDGLYGWVDSNNNLLLPYRWKNEDAINTDKYAFNFHQNGIDTEQFLKPTLERKWGKYILFRDAPYGRYGLMDANRNIKIPAGQVYRINGDTLFTARTLVTDSSTVNKVHSCSGYVTGAVHPPGSENASLWASMSTIIYTRWSLAALSPIDSTTQFVASWNAAAARHAAHESYQEASTKLTPSPERSPVIEREDIPHGEIVAFSKDSFYFSIKKCVVNSPCRKVNNYDPVNLWKFDDLQHDDFWYGCAGKVMGGYCDRLYGAVVDKDFNYLVKPLADLEIMGYNPGEDIIAVKALDNTYGLINSAGDTLMGFSNLELTGGYGWKNKVYAYTITHERSSELLSGNTREIYRVTDSAGRITQPWAAYQNNADPARSVQSGSGPVDLEDYFITYDSSETVVVLDSSGQKILPALCSQYRTLCKVGSHYFWGTNGTGGGRLVDSNNVDVFPGSNIHTVKPVTIRYDISERVAPSKQLYTVSGTFNDSNDSEMFFYFDGHGVTYTGDVRKKQPK